MEGLSQYRDLYLETSKDYLLKLNAALLILEKDPRNQEAIENIFRSAHSLKSQSAAMGYTDTALLCHTVEDIFYAIREGTLALTPSIADCLFASFDALTGSLHAIGEGKPEPALSTQVASLKALTGVITKSTEKFTRRKLSAPKVTASATPSTAPVIRPQGTKTISVKVDVLDEMMNILEEFLVVRLKLKDIVLQKDNSELKNYYDQSQKLLNSLQYQIMQARAVPLRLVFDHFPRAVRDLAHAENKKVEFIVEGGDLEIDRTIIDKLDEPIIHLLRNAVSHGIKEKGTVTLSATRERDYILLTIKDDGVGIAWQKIAQKADADETVHVKDVLFSGISTSTNVTQISGRGVGLKAVKKMVEECLGTIDVVSEPGKGTSFIIKLPLTLAIAKALIIKVDGKDYAIPSQAVNRIVRVSPGAMKKTVDQEMFVLDEQEISLLHFENLLPGHEKNPLKKAFPDSPLLVVVVESQNELLGLVVDEVMDSIDVVMKPVPEVFRNIKQYSGVTILNNGKAALILNPQEIV